MRDLYNEIAECVNQNKEAALCIITSIKGSTPGKAGFKMLVYPNGKISGSVGGGVMENTVIQHALDVLSEGKPKVFKHNLLSDHKMSCGGSVEIYIEPIGRLFKLFIFGAGHIGSKLAEYALKFNFDITLIDERKDIIDQINLGNVKIINKNYKNAFADLNFDNQCLIASVSHLHEYDKEIIAHCVKQPNAYIGMIGSKRKIAAAKKIYTEQNILSIEEMNSIDWPMGVPIECKTVEEIVISIMARLIDVRGKLMKDS